MAVVNPAKRAAAKGVKFKGITRKVFRGDPGLTKFTHNPEVLAGSRRLGANYKANQELRKRQQAPADRSTIAHKGPTKRASGITHDQWVKLMAGK